MRGIFGLVMSRIRFPEGEKPEWLTWEEILQYERRMTEEDK